MFQRNRQPVDHKAYRKDEDNWQAPRQDRRVYDCTTMPGEECMTASLCREGRVTAPLFREGRVTAPLCQERRVTALL